LWNPTVTGGRLGSALVGESDAEDAVLDAVLAVELAAAFADFGLLLLPHALRTSTATVVTTARARTLFTPSPL
jgi:hypothetical protein